MKISFDIDCTPEEARKFLGLPDVQAVNEMLIGEMKERMQSSMKNLGTEELLQFWMKSGFGNMMGTDGNPLVQKLAQFAPNLDMGQQGFEQMQKFWGEILQQTPKATPKDK